MLYIALQYQKINIIDDYYINTYNKDKDNSYELLLIH
jgi:ribosomal protein S18 acetylase RimI-like enzyme